MMAQLSNEDAKQKKHDSTAATVHDTASPPLRRSTRNLPAVIVIKDSDESEDDLSLHDRRTNSEQTKLPKINEIDKSPNASASGVCINSTYPSASATININEANNNNLVHGEGPYRKSIDASKLLEKNVSVRRNSNNNSKKRKRVLESDEDTAHESSWRKQNHEASEITDKCKKKVRVEIKEKVLPLDTRIQLGSEKALNPRDNKIFEPQIPTENLHSASSSSRSSAKSKGKEIATLNRDEINSGSPGCVNKTLFEQNNEDMEIQSDSNSLFSLLKTRSRIMNKKRSPQYINPSDPNNMTQGIESSTLSPNLLSVSSDAEHNTDSDHDLSAPVDYEPEIFSDEDLPLSDTSPHSYGLGTQILRQNQIPERTPNATRAQRRTNSPKEDRTVRERNRIEHFHPEFKTMWEDLEKIPKIGDVTMKQPDNINRELKPFQLQGVAWMKAMENTKWGGGLLGDEMGMGKTIQAVSLIMSDWPAKQPSLVLIPPVALLQWQQEINSYTDGTLKTFVFHGTNTKTKAITKSDLMKYDVILISYNSLESVYRKQEKGFRRKTGIHKENSIIHEINFHRVILDEAHNIKSRSTGAARACFALKAKHKWCLSGTPLQNRIGEFFSLVRFLDIRPFICYLCKQCPCSILNWNMNKDHRCNCCGHSGMQHISVFNYELLNPIQKYGNSGLGAKAFQKLRLLTDRFMLRRIKRDYTTAMELPAKEIHINRQFFGEEENDFASSIMNNGTRKFETYVAQGVLLNNYANIFGLILQMRQVADHPDLILKKDCDGGQNVLVCCICDEVAEEAIRSACRHDFCRECAKNYVRSSENPDCPQCHIQLSIDLEQPDIEQDDAVIKKSSIINRIKMENWFSSTKIETLVHELYKLRSKNMSHKSIIFSQFTTMLQLVEWRLRRAGISTVMLDGSMTPSQRQASINHFMTDVNVECFLVSLKAGGVALNLTEASKVFIVDPWWNPAAEWQSADRCHRIGQCRPCSITRLCIEDSVESRMVLLQEKKANMINSTINSDESAIENLTPEDLQFLFRGN